MNNQILTGILFFLYMYCFGIVYHVEAAGCPTSNRYAVINYNHQLLHQTIGAHTVSEASALSGPVGIKICPAGIVNAGNNTINRTIDLVYTTTKCDCLSDTAESRVTVTVTGTCANGILNMQILEVYPDSSALVTCTCDDGGGGQYTQSYFGYTVSFNLKMDYVNGNTITQPYTCPDCSGTYSWRLQFTDKPPPADALPVVPFITPLLFFSLD